MAEPQAEEPLGAGAYPVSLVPAVRPDDLVRLVPTGEVFRVKNFVPLSGIKAFASADGNDFSVGADGSTQKEVKAIRFEDNELGQVRLIQPGADLPPEFEVQVDLQQKQNAALTTREARGAINSDIGSTAGYNESTDSVVIGDAVQTNLAEFYVLEDGAPFFTFDNTDANNAHNVKDLSFAGFKYQLSPDTVSEPEDGFARRPVPLPIGTLP